MPLSMLSRDIYKRCTLCPRKCFVDRTAGARGVCRMGDTLLASRAALHLWEEPCLVGDAGSGTVFFSGCSLGCVYCQNRPISHEGKGVLLSVENLADTFLSLQEQGAANINLVTATPHLPLVAEALFIARDKGLSLPVVYNTSGYERVKTIRSLVGLVDIYLPDLKTLSRRRAIRYMHAPDYPEVALLAIDEMVRTVGAPVFDEKGQMQKGVIVRHLVLPKGELDARHVLRRLAAYGNDIYISLMSQYTPMPYVSDFPELSRRVFKTEYRHLTEYALSLGIEQLYVQEGESASESFIPAFDGTGLTRF